MSHQEEVKIDTNLYSRQIGTFGMEAMGKLIKMNVLIVGLRGLGVETAKNLILAGPRSVTLYDPNPVTWGDLSSNFNCREEHVGKISRAEASFEKLQELNPYVKVNVVSHLSLEDHANFHVVTYTEIFTNIDQVTEVNEFCRSKNVGFILSGNHGPYGYTFLDYGNDFQITDVDGEDTKSFIVVNVSNTNPCIVKVHRDKRHKFYDGDFVKFTEVEGMTELNQLPPTKISVIDGYSFKLDVDTTQFNPYSRQGLVENVKIPLKIKYHSLKQSLNNPVASSSDGMLITPDFRFFGRSEQLHLALRGIWQFQKETGRLPTTEDVPAVITNVKAINEQAKTSEGMSVDEIDEKVIHNAAAFARASITPMAAFFGGVVAQEIVKFTGKYSPLKQWLHYDIFESLPRGPADRTPMNCKYDDQILVYGREVQEKLTKVRTFMIGAGALGCEYVKAFALMGLGCSAEGKVTVTDNDNIEVSNLNRQFLFRKSNVGDSKSKVACSIAADINKDLNVHAHKLYVSQETEHVFNDNFWENLHFVVNAVDNIKARLYVDSRCVWYGKPLLESGTLGTKANTQMIIPPMTQCYGDSKDQEEEAIPMCTLRNFPSEIEHCIEWGRDLFNRLFVDRPNDASNYVSNPDGFVDSLKKVGDGTVSGIKDTLLEVQKLVELKNGANFDRCAEVAREYFEELYNNQIQNLLYNFPRDSIDKDGNPFWSGPKRAPDAISFNPQDPLHVHYVTATANLIAFTIGMKQNRDRDLIAAKAAGASYKKFEPKKISVEVPGEQQSQQNVVEAGTEDEQVILQVSQQMRSLQLNFNSKDIFPVDFEKDDDNNFHIDFIHAAANLRARNYKIHECDQQKTKMIAGKIIPAIATTTAMITGCVTAEIYKFVQGFTEIESFKNAFITLALPNFVFSEPDPAIKIADGNDEVLGRIKAVPQGFTIYDKIVIEGPKTIDEFLQIINQRNNVDITNVIYKDKKDGSEITLYDALHPSHGSRKSRLVEDVYFEVSPSSVSEGRRYFNLIVQGYCNVDACEIKMPPVQYFFKQ